MATKHVLVPFEPSDASIKAFQTALSIAKENQAKVTLVTVIKPLVQWGWSGNIVVDLFSEYIKNEYDRHKVEKLWEGLQQESKKMNVKFDATVISDSLPAKGIVKFARKNDVDLILMGHRRRTGWAKLQSSVSEEVQEMYPPRKVLVVN